MSEQVTNAAPEAAQNTANVKKVKKGGVLPKWVKNRWFIFFFLLFLFGCSIFVMFLMDAENFVRPSVLESPFFQSMLSFLGIKRFNIGITTWFLFMCIFSTFFVIFFICLFHNDFEKKLSEKYYLKNGLSWQKGNYTRFNIVFFTCCALVLGLCGLFLGLFFPWSKLNWNTVSINVFLNLIQSLGILICLLLVVPVAILLIILIFRLIILLLSVIIGGIAKTVMASSQYQDAYNASKMVSDRVRAEMNSGDGGSNGGSGSSGSGRNKIDHSSQDILFPALTKIDEKWAKINGESQEVNGEAKEPAPETPSEQPSEAPAPIETPKEEINKADLYSEFKDFALGFQAFLANKNHYYYDIDLLRCFIAGLSSSRLILLEGLSGTGKSTLPRVFLEYVGGKAYFFPVQATWRDKSDIIGYYSDFTGQYKETELLKHLYEASYTPSKINLMVLDEANISRMEYYFADFLSIFEYPSEDWLVPLMQIRPGQTTPKYIEEGMVRIPTNTWFIGTLNVDDSTFTVSDKVYDRSIVIDFRELNLPFTSKFNDDPHPLTCERLNAMFKDAQSQKGFNLNKSEREKFLKLCDYSTELFDIRFGNRIMNQIDLFVPVFVALGGKKEKALDFMFSRKILRKLEAQYDNYVDAGLAKLSRYIISQYGNGVFTESELLINKFRKKFF